MAEIVIPQAEADALLAMPKKKINDEGWQYPNGGFQINIPLISDDHREEFFLDIERTRINLLKGKYQSRARKVIGLARLDFDGAPHRNPDESVIPCPHLHVYKEGAGLKWAIPAPEAIFTDMNDRWRLLQQFMMYCNITDPPRIEKAVFM